MVMVRCSTLSVGILLAACGSAIGQNCEVDDLQRAAYFGVNLNPSPGVSQNCCRQSIVSGTTISLRAEWDITTTNLSSPTTEGAVSAFGFGVALVGEIVFGSADCGPLLNTLLDAVLSTDFAEAPDSLSVAADAAASAGGAQTAAVNAGGIARYSTAPGGGCFDASAGTGRLDGSWFARDNTGNGTIFGFAVGAAGAGGEASFEFVPNGPGSTGITVDFCIIAEGVIDTAYSATALPECNYPPSGSSSLSAVGGGAFSISATFTNDAGATETITEPGAFGLNPDGSIDSLGAFTGQTFTDTGINGNTKKTTDLSINLQPTIPNPTGVTLNISAETTGDRCGDLDDNCVAGAACEGVLDCMDRAAFQLLIGTAIGDPGYTIDADLNLDGTIDAADYNAFIIKLNNSPDFELADWNCNGICGPGSDDLLDFLADWFPSDLAAENNGDGTVDTGDLLNFLDAYFIGC